MTKTNILFIINPISGGRDKLNIPGIIDNNIDRTKFNANFRFTEYVGHAREIAEEAVTKSYDVLVAVGGDGTINEIGAVVMKHHKILGIIPFGSGNGLARFLRIPMGPAKAVQVINNLNVQKIDTALFNNKSYFNIAGIGFDAHLSSVFAGNKGRGLSGYFKLGLKEMLNYEPKEYNITIDGVMYVRKAFVVSIANSSQYGNNAHISPHASVTDGLLDVCVIKGFPLYKIPLLAYYMFSSHTDRTDLVEVIKGREIMISREQDAAIHIDGEPLMMGKELKISIVPLSLNIITPAYEA